MHVDLGACNLYADDMLVYCSANNINELQECTQKCVTAIKEWYDNNHLVINASNVVSWLSLLNNARPLIIY